MAGRAPLALTYPSSKSAPLAPYDGENEETEPLTGLTATDTEDRDGCLACVGDRHDDDTSVGDDDDEDDDSSPMLPPLERRRKGNNKTVFFFAVSTGAAVAVVALAWAFWGASSTDHPRVGSERGIEPVAAAGGEGGVHSAEGRTEGSRTGPATYAGDVAGVNSSAAVDFTNVAAEATGVGSKTSARRDGSPANMFDCDALPDSECVYFRPTAFFESPDGAGRPYINETLPWRAPSGANDSDRGSSLMLPRHSNFLRLRRVVTNSSSASAAAAARNLGGPRGNASALPVPRDQAYMHLHKNGGTTVELAMRAFVSKHRQGRGWRGRKRRRPKKKRRGGQQARDAYRLDDYYWARAHTMSLERRRVAVSRAMGAIADKQKKGGRVAKESVAFSFLRHPLRKFLSGLGEVMHQGRMRPCQFGKDDSDGDGDVQRQKIHLQGRELVECALNFLTGEGGPGLAFNQHFKPQSIELYDCAGGTDVVLSLLDMSSIGKYVGEGCLGLKQDFHSRSETGQYFPGGDPLKMLDENMVRKLCELYAVDVVFFRQIGREVPECDAYL